MTKSAVLRLVKRQPENHLDTTWQVIGSLQRSRVSETQKALVEDWLAITEQRLQAQLGTIEEHAALILLERINDDERITKAITKAERYPAQATSEHARILFETASYAPYREHTLLSQIPAGQPRLDTIIDRIVHSSFWNKGTLLFFLVATAMGLFSFSRELILGAIIGMIGASINEYTVHLGVGHASAKFAKSFRKLGVAGLFAEEINLAHRVHHAKMVTDFRADFSNVETLKRVDSYLDLEAAKLIRSRIEEGQNQSNQEASEIARIKKEIKAGGYGINGTRAGCIAMNVLAAPFFLINFGLAHFFMGPVFLISSCVFLSGFIMQSLYSHRYLHMTEVDLETSKSDGSTTAFMRWFMTTSVAKLQQRRHFRHHHEKYSYEGTANGVIMSFSFADFVFRGGVKEANANHLSSMRSEGFFGSTKT